LNGSANLRGAIATNAGIETIGAHVPARAIRLKEAIFANQQGAKMSFARIPIFAEVA
jgi:hypothetical protein